MVFDGVIRKIICGLFETQCSNNILIMPYCAVIGTSSDR